MCVCVYFATKNHKNFFFRNKIIRSLKQLAKKCFTRSTNYDLHLRVKHRSENDLA